MKATKTAHHKKRNKLVLPRKVYPKAMMPQSCDDGVYPRNRYPRRGIERTSLILYDGPHTAECVEGMQTDIGSNGSNSSCNLRLLACNTTVYAVVNLILGQWKGWVRRSWSSSGSGSGYPKP